MKQDTNNKKNSLLLLLHGHDDFSVTVRQKLYADLLPECPAPGCILIKRSCTHVKDPVVNARVRWVTETRKCRMHDQDY